MKIICIAFMLFPFFIFSQQHLEGEIYELSTNEKMPLPGANISWLNTSVGAVTDVNGKFKIPYKPANKKLIISYVGFKTDTLTITNSTKIEHTLVQSNSLDEVVIETRKKSTSVSYLKSMNVITMNSDELLKAACCNLCESFETNPSVDVHFADALTGARQIKMLGLSSPYILIGIESIPSIRGAAQSFGLSFIPGTWVESIQITKGTGSVIYGFESIAGQINAKLQKPMNDSKLFINAFGSGNGRLELNTHVNTKVAEKISTGIYVHGNMRDAKFDKNDDGFLDAPLMKQINIMNRWEYVDLDKGLISFLNFRILNDHKQLGQVDFNPDIDKYTTNAWGSEIDTDNYEVSGKVSYSNPELSFQSFNAQVAYSYHNQESYFGQNIYNIKQNSLYATALYGSIIGDTRHNFKTGINYSYDNYDEFVAVKVNPSETNYNWKEASIGAFFEYNYDDFDKLNITAGMRIDNSNVLGLFLTPRFNIRYTPWENSAIKASFGRGKRTAKIFAENQNMFATSRSINILSTGGNVYGLNPEIAWNYGISLMQGFNLFNRKADLVLDFYRTNFINQIVLDWETSTEANFYNLEGKSYSNNVLLEFNYNVLKGLDVRLAYKHFNVMTQYTSGELEKPLTPKDRIFGNVAYETEQKGAKNSQWKFDVTYNWLGQQRFPSTTASPVEYQLSTDTPTVGTLNFQVTKVFSPKFEVYAGGENVTNEKQENPIVSAEDPFGPYFDTTMVYGPIFGSSFYAGLRFRIE